MGTRTRTVAVFALVVALATTLLLAPVSVAAQETSEVDDVPAPMITIEPADGPNSKYVDVTGSNEFELHFNRVTPTFTSTYDEVFTITAGVPGSVWIDHEVAGVTFYTDDGEELTRSEPVGLQAGESVTIGVRIDAAAVRSGSAEFTIGIDHADGTMNRQLPSAETAALGMPLAAGLLFAFGRVGRRRKL